LINAVVNRFNENNKNIKEVNKQPKSDKDMQDLIRKNKEIQKDCDEIDTKVLKGKKFSNIILEKLDAILNPKIPDV